LSYRSGLGGMQLKIQTNPSVDEKEDNNLDCEQKARSQQ